MRFWRLEVRLSLVLGGSGLVCHAQFQGTTAAPDPVPLRVSYYRYETDNRLHFLIPEQDEGVDSLSFGTVITNLVRAPAFVAYLQAGQFNVAATATVTAGWKCQSWPTKGRR